MRRKILIEKMLVVCVAAAVITFAQTGASFAHSGTADEQAACTPDVLSLCFWQIPNEDRIVECLNKNIKKLSPACRKVIDGPPDKKDDRSKR
ncbi:hypothetical protein [Hyphomicrobium sp. 99]|uniref:hypothetical protein n=1 Tax=Hyphomicrobium sp. 99 TaxID=1163419 RepID=UPI001FDA0B46|nr:hypothetical protein [Hyphomicrobium sp. 99]